MIPNCISTVELLEFLALKVRAAKALGDKPYETWLRGLVGEIVAHFQPDLDDYDGQH